MIWRIFPISANNLLDLQMHWILHFILNLVTDWLLINSELSYSIYSLQLKFYPAMR